MRFAVLRFENGELTNCVRAHSPERLRSPRKGNKMDFPTVLATLATSLMHRSI